MTKSIHEKITCKLCDAQVHSIQIHIKDQHAQEITFNDYKERYPGEPILSAAATEKLKAVKKKRAKEGVESALLENEEMVPLDKLFNLKGVKEARSKSGDPIMIRRFVTGVGAEMDMIPDIDDGFVYDIDTLKNILLGLSLNIPVYLWGHAGTGKSSFFENIAAVTRHGISRVQHTINTEESHIVGQWVVKGGELVFNPGPLVIAMREGLIYMADEYDFAMPSVLSVYQAVLEGKPLVIKEADAENRVIRPHPNFRFVATGNTNGSGDESGLYQGTNTQNAANYDRFGVTCMLNYMKKPVEINIIMLRTGISKSEAESLVDYATAIREAFDANKISSTISPRALINAAKLGLRRGCYTMGINLAFANKLSPVDRQVSDGLAQRILG